MLWWGGRPQRAATMLFNSYAFIFGFLPVVLVGFFTVGRVAGAYAACAWLAAASLFFYAWWQPIFVLLLIASILGNAVLGRYLMTMPEPWKRRGLVVGIVLNLALLGYFKYAGFLVFNLNHLLSTPLAIPHIVLPIGISFYTFQQIAYLCDSAEGHVRDFSLVNYTLFVTFFPHLIAGPIVHHREMMPQFAQRSVIRFAPMNLVVGLSIFTIGLFKKTVLADVTAAWADPTFNAAATGVAPDPARAWVAALAFTFQLYFDFSGYSDMAIGLARMFNIVLPLNFYSPYKAVNIIEFWRRWHMTLSRFLRDYVYVPLGGNRKGTLRRYGNLLAVMAVGGLWHGAAWTFVVWGTLHGIMLMLNHGWHALRRIAGLAPRPEWRAIRVAATALTFVLVVCAWVFFRAADVPTASRMLGSMFGLNGRSVSASVATFARDQQAQVSRLTSAIVRGRLNRAPGRVADLDLPGPWLLMLGLVVFAAPNTYQLFATYDPALVETKMASERPRPRLSWQASAAWAAALAVMFVASLLQLLKLSPFLYFQF
jgi:D-alanyl-lipoteichoic acid acyltransferase DltB (MBOAT superfamily)